jgi:hypothetical protein
MRKEKSNDCYTQVEIPIFAQKLSRTTGLFSLWIFSRHSMFLKIVCLSKARHRMLAKHPMSLKIKPSLNIKNLLGFIF